MFINKCVTDLSLTNWISPSNILTLNLTYCLQKFIREKKPQSDTSCELLSSTESEISECNGTLVNMSVHGNFIEYALEDQSVHVKVLRSKDDNKIKTEKVSTLSSKEWKLHVKLEEKKQVKKHMEGVRVRRKLALQRKRHKEYVLNKWPQSDTSISSEDEMLSVVGKSNNEHDYSLPAHSEQNKPDVTNGKVHPELSANRSVNTKRDHSYSVQINADMSTKDMSNVQMYDNICVEMSENTDKVCNINADMSTKDMTNVDMYKNISVEISENTDKVSQIQIEADGEMNNTTTESSVCDNNVVKSKEVSHELYYVIGLPIRWPKEDPKPENLSWFLDTFQREISMGDESANDIFDGFLQQTDLKQIKPEHLRTMLKEYIVQERAVVEPIIKANMKAQCMTYNNLVTFLTKSNTNRMDLTLKALSIMFKKSIMVIAKDYLWLSHSRPFENFDILYILFKGDHFASATS